MDVSNITFLETILDDSNRGRVSTDDQKRDYTPDIIKRTGKISKIDRNNAFRGLKFDTERA